MRKLRTLHEFLLEQLSDAAAAIDYVDMTFEEYQGDGDTVFFLKELRLIIEVKGGVAAIAEKADMTPEALSEVLASEEVPRLDTLRAILGALGYRLASQPLTAENTQQETQTENVTPAPEAALKAGTLFDKLCLFRLSNLRRTADEKISDVGRILN